MSDLDVSIVSVDGSVWSGTAASVTSTTVEGEMGILYGRQPILAQMAEDGVVTVHSADGDFLVFAVSGGLLSCTGKHVMVMAEKAIPPTTYLLRMLRSSWLIFQRILPSGSGLICVHKFVPLRDSLQQHSKKRIDDFVLYLDSNDKLEIEVEFKVCCPYVVG